MMNPYDWRQFRGSSNFDARHQLNANALYDLPVGTGKLLLSNAPSWLDQIVGGWQISSIMRYRTGYPTTVSYGGFWPVNWGPGALAYAIAPYENKVGYNEFGIPSIFPRTTDAAKWRPSEAGTVGTRASVRLDDFINTDIAITKTFKMPWESHRVEFRAEAFNAFNNVNFINPTLNAGTGRAIFGQFTAATEARVMQFALRYEF
jgi:hypothetical protein